MSVKSYTSGLLLELQVWKSSCKSWDHFYTLFSHLSFMGYFRDVKNHCLRMTQTSLPMNAAWVSSVEFCKKKGKGIFYLSILLQKWKISPNASKTPLIIFSHEPIVLHLKPSNVHVDKIHWDHLNAFSAFEETVAIILIKGTIGYAKRDPDVDT